MKTKLFVLIIALMLWLASLAPATLNFSRTGVPVTVPLHRWYCPGNGDHFYTSDIQEHIWMQTNMTQWYIYEGIQCYVFPCSVEAYSDGSIGN